MHEFALFFTFLSKKSLPGKPPRVLPTYRRKSWQSSVKSSPFGVSRSAIRIMNLSPEIT
jgi:hypothetical protein